MKGQKLDEFAFILLAGIIFIAIIVLTLPPAVESKPVVNPRKIVLNGLNGTSRGVSLEIIGNNTNISLSADGEIAKFVDFSDNYFDVFIKKNVLIYFDLPNRVGKFLGNIYVNYKGGKIKIPVEVNVVSSKEKILSFSEIGPFDPFILEYGENEKILRNETQFEISRGFFGSKIKAISAEINNLNKVEKIVLKFEVIESNKLGDLIIRYNGNVIYKGKPSLGIVELEIPLNKIVNIEFDCEKPSYQFWTSTYYKLKNVRLIEKLKTNAIKTFNFTLSNDQISNFDHFKIALYFDSSQSKGRSLLEIKVNGKVVYEGRPHTIYEEIEFSKDIFGNPIYLSKENKIEFKILEQGKWVVKSWSFYVYYLS
ncbi:MAG: hypothetical protein B6U78_00435 [Candidatus Aenigmarchaeota archaeon ex4484_224]|nr:MAG: hypothetical protein B6U78_00435 [Candidatus Aenigmarchaeota archaeon ex4484_224]